MTSIEDLIDSAIADYETSPDAMRWTTDPPKEEIVSAIEYASGGWRPSDHSPSSDVSEVLAITVQLIVRPAGWSWPPISVGDPSMPYFRRLLPLPIDGHSYRRRSLARRRRK